MNIKLKEGKTFVHPETGQELTALFGGMKNLNISIENASLNFQVKFFASQELMLAGKKEIFKTTFSIIDEEEGEKNLTAMLSLPPIGSYIKEVIEKAIYDYIIALEDYSDFEVVV